MPALSDMDAQDDAIIIIILANCTDNAMLL